MKIIILLALIISLAGCADKVASDLVDGYEKVGFLYGFWHGMILPFSFVASFFDETIAIYAEYNNGNWYNFGFFLGLYSLFSSSRSSSESQAKTT